MSSPLSPPRFSRYPHVAFGDRLAQARNLHHTEASLLPPPRPVAAIADGGVQLSRSTTPPVEAKDSSSTSRLSSTATAVRHDSSWYGREKGSYMSPYDYNIAGRTAYGNTLRPSQPAQPGLLPGLGAHLVRGNSRSETIRSEAISAADTTEPAKHAPLEKTSEVKVAQPPSDAKERLLLLVPLRIIRKLCTDTPGLDLLATFIDTHMADSLHTVVQRDAIIPSIVYMVTIPMTDEHWEMYNQVLCRCGRALEVHEMLSVGRDMFDQWSDPTAPPLNMAQRDAYMRLESGVATGQSLEEVLTELVQDHRWMWMTAGSGYAGDLERGMR
ncbi:Nn.00g097010.m01.CDS01 [Neocucurbitaria sp. VM-36]